MNSNVRASSTLAPSTNTNINVMSNYHIGLTNLGEIVVEDEENLQIVFPKEVTLQFYYCLCTYFNNNLYKSKSKLC